MPPTTAGTRSALRDRPLGRILALAAVLLAAFVATRSCASTQHEVSKEEAVAIARKQITFEPERMQIRFVQRGIPVRGFWAVSFSTVDAKGDLKRVAVVLVDAETGAVSK